MHELVNGLFIVMLILFVLVVLMLFMSGRDDHRLNGHVEMPEEAFDPRTLLRTQKEDVAEASEFFDHIEELRRDFA